MLLEPKWKPASINQAAKMFNENGNEWTEWRNLAKQKREEAGRMPKKKKQVASK